MAWYFIFLNFLFAMIVVGTICGMHSWAIATQHHDWPARDREIAQSPAAYEPGITAELIPQPALS